MALSSRCKARRRGFWARSGASSCSQTWPSCDASFSSGKANKPRSCCSGGTCSIVCRASAMAASAAARLPRLAWARACNDASLTAVAPAAWPAASRPAVAVTDLLGGSHRRGTVALGRMVVASGKRELGEDASEVAELDIEAVVLGWRPAVVQQPVYPRHIQSDLIGQLGWLSREVDAGNVLDRLIKVLNGGRARGQSVQAVTSG